MLPRYFGTLNVRHLKFSISERTVRKRPKNCHTAQMIQGLDTFGECRSDRSLKRLKLFDFLLSSSDWCYKERIQKKG